jgi:hypothetical protein
VTTQNFSRKKPHTENDRSLPSHAGVRIRRVTSFLVSAASFALHFLHFVVKIPGCSSTFVKPPGAGLICTFCHPGLFYICVKIPGAVLQFVLNPGLICQKCVKIPGCSAICSKSSAINGKSPGLFFKNTQNSNTLRGCNTSPSNTQRVSKREKLRTEARCRRAGRRAASQITFCQQPHTCCSPANSDSIHYQFIYSLLELPRDIHQARAYATMGRSSVLPRPEPRAMSAKTGLDCWSLFNAWLDKFSPSLVSLVFD